MNPLANGPSLHIHIWPPTSCDIANQPFVLSSRQVWSYQNSHIHFGDLLAYLHAVHNNKWPQKVPLYPLSPLYILTICCIVITIQYWITSSAHKQESIIHQISSILRNRLKDIGNQTFESYVKRKQLAQTWSSVVVLKIKVPVYT